MKDPKNKDINHFLDQDDPVKAYENYASEEDRHFQEWMAGSSERVIEDDSSAYDNWERENYSTGV